MALQLMNRTYFAPRPRGARGCLDWVDVAVVGAGPAGLAVSSELSRARVRHVVLERGRVGETWRTQRWEAFQLNGQVSITRVPGELLAGPPDKFPSAGELVNGLERFAEGLPIMEKVEVLRAEPVRQHWRLATSEGLLCARTVVVASGFQNVPRRPPYANSLPREIAQLHVADYWRPGDLDDAVLVVGGGQSGVQVAADLLAGGRRVYLSTSFVGRMPGCAKPASSISHASRPNRRRSRQHCRRSREPRTAPASAINTLPAMAPPCSGERSAGTGINSVSQPTSGRTFATQTRSPNRSAPPGMPMPASPPASARACGRTIPQTRPRKSSTT